MHSTVDNLPPSLEGEHNMLPLLPLDLVPTALLPLPVQFTMLWTMKYPNDPRAPNVQGSQRISMVIKRDSETRTLSARPFYNTLFHLWTLEKVDETYKLTDNVNERLSAQQLYVNDMMRKDPLPWTFHYYNMWHLLPMDKREEWECKSTQAIKAEDDKHTTTLANIAVDLAENPVGLASKSSTLLAGNLVLESECKRLSVELDFYTTKSEIEEALYRRRYIQLTCPTLPSPLVLIVEQCCVEPPGQFWDRMHALIFYSQN